MKKLILGMALILGAAFSANAQSATKKSDSKSKTETVQLKDHVCTSACKPGACSFAHGEKGHTCTTDCKKMETSQKDKMPMKDHVCTSACKNGSHMYAHGEKGHTCTEDCKKKM